MLHYQLYNTTGRSTTDQNEIMEIEVDYYKYIYIYKYIYTSTIQDNEKQKKYIENTKKSDKTM